MIFDQEPRLVESVFSTDHRGTFSKPYPLRDGTPFSVAEIFWSESGRGSIRGLHFQFEPHEIGKLVWVSAGAVFDVAVDLRDGPTFGHVHSFSLDAASSAAAFVPAGFAHGFQVLTESAVVNYAQDAAYAPEDDAGIRWDSAGVAWPLPVSAISDRDRAHPPLELFTRRFGAAQ